MNFFKKLWEKIFPPKKEKVDCDFKVIKFNEIKRPKNYGKRNPKKVDELTYDVTVEAAPGGKKGKPVKTTSTTTTSTSTTVTNTTTKPPAGSYDAVIFLDFDGGFVSGTSWNVSGDIMADSANLTEAEQDIILNNAIEDYSPFKVTVTRDQAVFSSAPSNRRIRCIITESNEWYGNNAGGVAYVGSFNWGNDTPCWVFSTLLGYNTKNIQEAVSHEVGHTLGLRHQASWDVNCNLISSYNFGANGEAPIMGVGYYQPDVHWWVGPTNLGCTNIQDDVKVLTSVLGLK